MHEESGLAALKACGLLNQAIALTGDCTEEQKIADKNGNILFQDEGSNVRPEIYRNDLTKLLASQIPSEAIRWDRKLVGAKRTPMPISSEVVLDFGEHGTHICDLVIGADGAWSRVRPLLTDRKPHFADMHNITITIRQITKKHPDLVSLVGHGSFTCLANNVGVFAKRAKQDSCRLYIMLTTKDEKFSTSSGLGNKTPLHAKERLVADGAVFSQWGSPIRRLVSAACEDESAHNAEAMLDIRPFYTLPPGHSWKHRADATLIGDAAHLTNPPAGEGVNIAMKDALLLSQAVLRSHGLAGQNGDSLKQALDYAIKEFELEMAARALSMAEMTEGISRIMFGKDNGSLALTNWFHTMLGTPV